MSRYKNSAGFSVIEGLMAVMVLAIVGVLGYTFVTHMDPDNHVASSEVQTAPDSLTQINSIRTISDFNTAERELSAIDIGSESDTATLSSLLEEL